MRPSISEMRENKVFWILVFIMSLVIGNLYAWNYELVGNCVGLIVVAVVFYKLVYKEAYKEGKLITRKHKGE